MSEIHDKVRAMGLAFTPDQIAASLALFTPLLPAYDEAGVVRDIAYGADARHRLDLFGTKDKGSAARPVVVFIHGGGFVMGDKGNAGQPFYSNVGAWAARQGWIGCTATYRLAPDNPWPAGVEDMSAIVAWLRANVADHGGDPDKIVLMGQSAGAAHVGAYVGSALSAETAAASLAGAVMMSGVYDLVNATHSTYETAYYGSDSSRFAEQSSIEGLARTTVPCLYTLAENDPEPFQRQAALVIARRVAEQGKWPDFVRLEAQNHITPVHQIGGSADEVGPILANFIAKVTAG